MAMEHSGGGGGDERLLMILFRMVCSSVMLISMSCGHKQTLVTRAQTRFFAPLPAKEALTGPASCLKRLLNPASIWLSSNRS